MRIEHTESWQHLADTLGFRNEEDMLKNLYIQQGFSLAELVKIFGYSAWAIRRRLVLLGVPMRARGGAANRVGRRSLKSVSDAVLEESSPAELAILHGVHVSTVHAEKRLRRKESNAILSSVSDPLFGLSDSFGESYGPGSVGDEE